MLYFIDLFCGAGGVTEGVKCATDSNGNKVAKVIYCINHDEIAIKSHEMNHPECIHTLEDIRTFDVSKIVKEVEAIRLSDPEAIIVIWASIDCTQHSKAKGGLPKDPDSRTLAWHLFKYVDGINPDYLMVENVREFMKWGHLDENNYPIKAKEGFYFYEWLEMINDCGYRNEYKILNSANYGAYQCRERLFIIFAKPEFPIVFPEPTHSQKATNLKQWKPVREVLELDDKGKSIFNRKKELCAKTKARILAGLKKHILKGDTEFIQEYYSSPKNDKVSPINIPCKTLTTIPHQGLVSVVKPDEQAFIMKYLGNNMKTGINNGLPISEPSITITTQNRISLVSIDTDFLMRYNSGDKLLLKLDKPSGTLLTKDTFAKVHFALINHQWAIDADKQIASTIIGTQSGQYQIHIAINKDDCAITREIKVIMAHLGIVDIKMRMLNIGELKRIQGFPESYILLGSQDKQKKFIGNAVHTNMAQAITECIAKANKKKLSWDFETVTFIVD
jgi:DNA (cytosine-5)-methyltransferase 1